jgi:hypothetical protein
MNGATSYVVKRLVAVTNGIQGKGAAFGIGVRSRRCRTGTGTLERPWDRLVRVAPFVVMLCATAASGAEPAKPVFSFSSFGTLGLVHSDEDRADFATTASKPNGPGYSHSWSADVDSLAGAQLSARITPRLSAVLQVIAEQNYDSTYRPHVEWANLQYLLMPDFSVRFGRTVLPTFLYSGSRKVGYTYPWVRAPVEVYSRVPVTASDGVDAIYRMHRGDFTHSIQANYGSAQQKLPHSGGTVTAKEAWGVTYTVDYHAATVHLAYQRPTLYSDAGAGLFDAFRMFGPQGIAIADKYEINDKPLSIIAAGASYDPGKWFVTGEWTRTKNRSLIGDASGWYVSGGYRIGKFTPYVTYAKASADNLSDPGLDLSTLPPFLVGTAAGLNATLNSLLRQKVVQDTISIGGRWEMTRNAALKLQFDHTRIGAGSNGLMTNLQPDFQPGGKVNLVSATIDFVY